MSPEERKEEQKPAPGEEGEKEAVTEFAEFAEEEPGAPQKPPEGTAPPPAAPEPPKVEKPGDFAEIVEEPAPVPKPPEPAGAVAPPAPAQPPVEEFAEFNEETPAKPEETPVPKPQAPTLPPPEGMRTPSPPPPAQVPPPAPPAEMRQGLTNAQRGALAGGKGLVNGGGLTNGRGRTNGLVNGRRGLVNGAGLVNGKPRQGLVNGKGLINGGGLVNGRRRHGLVNGNGLINGIGLTNGKGLINGNGLINGRGLTNGRRLLYAERPPIRARSRWKIGIGLAALVVTLMLLLPYIVLLQRGGIVVDGSYGDWQQKFDDRSVILFEDDGSDRTENPDINIVAFAAKAENDYLYFYLKVAGSAFAGRDGGADTLYMFIDTKPDDAGAGYEVRSPSGAIRANFMVEMLGWDGFVKHSLLSQYDPGKAKDRDPADLAGWTGAGRGRVAPVGSEIEGAVSLRTLEITPEQPGVRVLFRFQDSKGNSDDTDFTAGIQGNAGVLSMEQRLRYGDIVGSNDVPMLDLTATAKGTNMTLSRLVFTRLGGGVSSVTVREGGNTYGPVGFSGSRATVSISPQPLPKDGSRGYTVFADMGGSGTAAGLSVAFSEDVAINGPGVGSVGAVEKRLAYVNSRPADIAIDGAFADWDGPGVARFTDASGDVERGVFIIPPVTDTAGAGGTGSGNPNVDLSEFRGVSDTNFAALYLRTSGKMMGGFEVMGPKTRLVGEGGAATTQHELKAILGSDGAFIFIDTKRGRPGFKPTEDFPITADYYIFLAGKGGRVSEKELFAYKGGVTSGSWSWDRVANVEADTDESRLETRVALSTLGLSATSSFGVYIYMEDWEGNTDHTDTAWQRSGGRASSTLRIEQTIPGGGRAPAPGTHARVLDLTLRASGDDISISAVGFENNGTADWRDVAYMELKGEDGAVLATAPLTALGAQFRFSPAIGIANGGVVRLSLDAVLSPGASAGRSLSLRVAPASVESTSALVLVAPPPDEVRGLVIGKAGSGRPNEDPVPEFSDVLVPAAAVAAMAFMVMRKRRKKARVS